MKFHIGLKIGIILIATGLISTLLLTQKTFAYVFENNDTLSAAIFPELRADVTNRTTRKDLLGNTFFIQEKAANYEVAKISPSGTILWGTLLSIAKEPVTQYSMESFIPDNLGGLYVVCNRSVLDGSVGYAVLNLHVRHYDANRTLDLVETNVLDTLFSHRLVKGVADENGRLKIIYRQFNFGDAISGAMPHPMELKVITVDLDGGLQDSIYDQENNPVESENCTNNTGTAVTVDFDIPIYSWTSCWNWCQDNMTTANPLCQYNADGLRNCWINAAPAGDINNCTWAPYANQYPTYAGVLGEESLQPVAGATILTYPNTGAIVSVIDSKYNAGTFYFAYRISAAGYSETYVQGVNAAGALVFSDNGILIRDHIATGASTSVKFTDFGWFATETVDTNADDIYDTYYYRKFIWSGAEQWDVAKSTIVEYFPANGELVGYSVLSGTSSYLVYEQWDYDFSATFAPYTVRKIDEDGNLLFQTTWESMPTTLSLTSGVTDDHGGVMFWGTNISGLGTQLVWLKNDNIINYGTNDFVLSESDSTESIPYNICSSDGGDGFFCLVRSGGREYVRTFDTAYQTDAVSGIDVRNSGGVSVIPGSDIGIGAAFPSYQDVLTMYSGSTPLSEFSATVSADRDWTAVSGGVDVPLGKSFVSGLIGSTGVAATHTLYVPQIAGKENVRVVVCPSATSLTEVSQSCASGYAVWAGGANLTATNIGGTNFWKLAQLTGTGAESSTVNSLVMDVNLTDTYVDSYVQVTIRALDAEGNVDTSYRGRIDISSSVPIDGLPTEYLFTEADNGERVFPGVIFTQAGTYSFHVEDSVDALLTVNSPQILVRNRTIVPVILPPGGGGGEEEEDDVETGIEITDVSSIITAENKIMVCWNTDVESKGAVAYSSPSEAERTVAESDFSNERHCVELVEWTEDVDYAFTITAENREGDTDDYVGSIRFSKTDTGTDKPPINGDDNGNGDTDGATAPIVKAVAEILNASVGPAIALGFGFLINGIPLTAVIISWWFNFLVFIGVRKKGKPYAVVYDSVTKEPLSQAIVRIFNEENALVRTEVTNVYGIFSTSLPKGKYRFVVSRSGYKFPSAIVRNTEDGEFLRVNRGEYVEFDGEPEIIISLPVDLVENRFGVIVRAFARNQILVILRALQLLAFLIAFGYSLNVFVNDQLVLNAVFLLLYVPSFVVLIYGSRYNLKLGVLKDEKGKKLAGVMLGVKETDFERVVARRVTDKDGLYRLILHQGTYALASLDERYIGKESGGHIVPEIKAEKAPFVYAENIQVKKNM